MAKVRRDGLQRFDQWFADCNKNLHGPRRFDLNRRRFGAIVIAASHDIRARCAAVSREAMLTDGNYAELARRAVQIESRTNLLFSFEKMALRDAVKTEAGARRCAEGLHAFLQSGRANEAAFTRWCEVVEGLPRRQTRVLTWPIVTVFGFIAAPTRHIFLKPNVTKLAAREYGVEFDYRSKPNWETYNSLLDFAGQVRRDQAALGPRDMIDLQSFIWVMGSNEYEE